MLEEANEKKEKIACVVMIMTNTICKQYNELISFLVFNGLLIKQQKQRKII